MHEVGVLTTIAETPADINAPLAGFWRHPLTGVRGSVTIFP
jgi:hypothetical protein